MIRTLVVKLDRIVPLSNFGHRDPCPVKRIQRVFSSTVSSGRMTNNPRDIYSRRINSTPNISATIILGLLIFCVTDRLSPDTGAAAGSMNCNCHEPPCAVCHPESVAVCHPDTALAVISHLALRNCVSVSSSAYLVLCEGNAARLSAVIIHMNHDRTRCSLVIY